MLTDCHEVWHNDARQDYRSCEIVEIHLTVKTKIADSRLRKSNPGFDTT